MNLFFATLKWAPNAKHSLVFDPGNNEGCHAELTNWMIAIGSPQYVAIDRGQLRQWQSFCVVLEADLTSERRHQEVRNTLEHFYGSL
jgi:hypothetical protein